ncbi:MAG: IS200/IS605 family transposase [Planctomycetota bacterium]|nr:IS200/IS605 family transposase [Planctomycetota bacterium]
MATTLTSILVHVTFSTKGRDPTLPLDPRPELFRYMGGICRDMHSALLHAGGVADHVHLLVSLGKTTSIADLMLHAKRGTSSWMKHQVPLFAWQDGYFAFSVGHDTIDAVRAYLDRQEEHHRGTDFKQEVLACLAKYRVEHDPRYLWD